MKTAEQTESDTLHTEATLRVTRSLALQTTNLKRNISPGPVFRAHASASVRAWAICSQPS